MLPCPLDMISPLLRGSEKDYTLKTKTIIPPIFSRMSSG